MTEFEYKKNDLEIRINRLSNSSKNLKAPGALKKLKRQYRNLLNTVAAQA